MAASDQWSGSRRRLCRVHNAVDSFCRDHKYACCEDCHVLIYTRCIVVAPQKAIDELTAYFDELQNELNDVMSTQRSNTPDLCTEKETSTLAAIQNYYSEIRKAIDDSENQAIIQIRKEFAKLRSDALNNEEKYARIHEELRRLNKELLVLHARESRITKLTDKKISQEGTLPEGAAVVDETDVLRRDAGTRADNESAVFAEHMSETTLELRNLLSIYNETLGQLQETSIDLTLIECKIDRGKVDDIRTILRESMKVITRDVPFKKVVYQMQFSINGSFPAVRFAEKNKNSPLLISTQSPNKLMVVSQKGKVLRSVDLRNSPSDLFVRSGRVFVTHKDASEITVHRLNDLSMSAKFSVPGGCFGIDGLNDKLAVVFNAAKCVRILQSNGGVVAESIYKFRFPTFIVVSRGNDVIYVTDEHAHSIVVLSNNLSALKTISHTNLEEPRGLCFFGSSELYTLLLDKNCFFRVGIDGSDCRVVLSGRLIGRPRSLCYDPYSRRVVIGNYMCDDLEIIKIMMYEGEF